MDGIQIAVYMACNWSLSTNQRYAEMTKDRITANKIK